MAIKNWLDSFDNWITAADWSGGTLPGAADDVVIDSGAPRVTTAVPTVKSITVNAELDFLGGSVSTSAGVNNSGLLLLDSNGGGGEPFRRRHADQQRLPPHRQHRADRLRQRDRRGARHQ